MDKTCRLCGKQLPKVSDGRSIADVDDEEFKNWATYLFNHEGALKQDGFPLVVCKPCVDIAKNLHGFASKCAELNKTDFPKQDWWAKLKN